MYGRDSSVSIATSYGVDGPGIESQWGAGFSALVQTGPRAHPAAYTMGSGSFSAVKRPGRGVDNPPHPAPKLKKGQSYTSTPPLDLRGLFQGELYSAVMLCCKLTEKAVLTTVFYEDN